MAIGPAPRFLNIAATLNNKAVKGNSVDDHRNGYAYKFIDANATAATRTAPSGGTLAHGQTTMHH